MRSNTYVRRCFMLSKNIFLFLTVDRLFSNRKLKYICKMVIRYDWPHAGIGRTQNIISYSNMPNILRSIVIEYPLLISHWQWLVLPKCMFPRLTQFMSRILIIIVTLMTSSKQLLCRCRRASGTQEQEYPPPLPLGTADPATVRRESDPRIIGDHPGAGVPTR